jgi:hypothetical protein
LISGAQFITGQIARGCFFLFVIDGAFILSETFFSRKAKQGNQSRKDKTAQWLKLKNKLLQNTGNKQAKIRKKRMLLLNLI